MRQLLDGQEQCSRMKLMLVRPEMKSINNSHTIFSNILIGDTGGPGERGQVDPAASSASSLVAQGRQGAAQDDVRLARQEPTGVL